MAIDPNKTVDHFEMETILYMTIRMTEEEYQEYQENLENSNDESSGEET